MTEFLNVLNVVFITLCCYYSLSRLTLNVQVSSDVWEMSYNNIYYIGTFGLTIGVYIVKANKITSI